jgi:hypothetical protein
LTAELSGDSKVIAIIGPVLGRDSIEHYRTNASRDLLTSTIAEVGRVGEKTMREGDQHLVHSPKNEDIVIVLREIARGEKEDRNGKITER